jgi:hypothetical protein
MREPDFSEELTLFTLHIFHTALVSISERPLAGLPLGLISLTLHNLFPTSRKTHCVLTKANLLMSCRKIIIFYSDNMTKLINTFLAE